MHAARLGHARAILMTDQCFPFYAAVKHAHGWTGAHTLATLMTDPAFPSFAALFFLCCSEACARLDWHTHEPYCKWATNGQWMQPGCRSSQQLWVTNAAQAVVRAKLKQQSLLARNAASMGTEFDMEEEVNKVGRLF